MAKKKATPRKPQINFPADPAFKADLEAVAKENGLTLPYFVKMIVTRHVDEYRRKRPSNGHSEDK